MTALLTPTQMGANDDLDFVVVTLGSLKPKMPWQTALQVCHHLRMHSKQAARFDRVPANFWRDVAVVDLDDCPAPHPTFRRSTLQQNFKKWEVGSNPPLVALIFDGQWTQMGYEDGIKLHHEIRRAARRAKAWAGDTSKVSTALANLTDAEDDYRLGLQ